MNTNTIFILNLFEGKTKQKKNKEHKQMKYKYYLNKIIQNFDYDIFMKK